MPDLSYTSRNVRPMDGARVRQVTAGAALAMGDWVYIDSAGLAQKSVNASGYAVGVVVAGDQKAATMASGEVVTICFFGPIAGYTSMTPGRLGYLSANAGKIADSGSKSVGYSWSADIFMVMPGAAVSAS